MKPLLVEYKPDQFLGKLRLGCSSYFFSKKSQKQEKKDLYISIQVWGDSARQVVERFPKGSIVFVRGPLDISVYTDRNGVQRTGVSVNVGGYDTRLFGFRQDLGEPSGDDHLLGDEPDGPSELFEDEPADEFV